MNRPKLVAALALSALAATASAAFAQAPPPPAQYPPGYAPPPAQQQAPAQYPPGYAPPQGAPPAQYPPGYRPPPAPPPGQYPPGYAPPPGQQPPPGYNPAAARQAAPAPQYPPPGYPPPAPPPAPYGAPAYPQPGYGPYQVPPNVYGQSMGAAEGAETHDGFFLRFGLGGNYVTTSNSDGGKTAWSGPGMSIQLAIGGAVVENLVVFGELIGFTAGSPTLEDGGRKAEIQNNLNVSGLGAGVAYYIMPLNLSVGGSLLLSFLNVENQTIRGEDPKAGFGGSLQIGKEFFVSDEFGIGGLLTGFAGRNEWAGYKFTHFAGSLALVATYN